MDIKEDKAAPEDSLQQLVDEYTTRKQTSLMQMKKGIQSKEEFLQEALEHIGAYYHKSEEEDKELLNRFEQYIFGYSRLSELINDPEVSDIRVISYDNIRMKKLGRRQTSGVSFASPQGVSGVH